MQNDNSNNERVIVQTDADSLNGQNKCPKCGATDISTNPASGKLRCNYCRFEFDLEKITGMFTNLKELSGEVVGSGASDIIADTNEVVTFKCDSCGAEVVIDTASASQARCHWCRNYLSVNKQIPNGSIPDAVLPFAVSKDEAKTQIEKFVNKRKFFAHPKFKAEFTTENIMGVYFPYMLVDINAHANFTGEGERQVKMYFKGSGNNRQTYYDADSYYIEREFDLIINGLSVESNSNRLNNNDNTKTNNVINAIMPFDVENAVKYNANYLKGYTSERRDINVDQLKDIVNVESKDIARFAANESLQEYDRGVCWNREDFTLKGEQWTSAYLPVWLYSYQQVNGNKKILHYVAVNARTKETMGSVPIHIPKLIGVSIIVEICGIISMAFIDWDYNFLFLFAGIIFFIFMFIKYRNNNARHSYETETKKEISNLRKVDKYIATKKGLTNSNMRSANNERVNGANADNKILDSFSTENLSKNIVNSITSNNPLETFINNTINKGGK